MRSSAIDREVCTVLHELHIVRPVCSVRLCGECADSAPMGKGIRRGVCANAFTLQAH
jgi:hypothetical protein